MATCDCSGNVDVYKNSQLHAAMPNFLHSFSIRTCTDSDALPMRKTLLIWQWQAPPLAVTFSGNDKSVLGIMVRGLRVTNAISQLFYAEYL